MTLKLITDSSSEIPFDEAKEKGIYLVPMIVFFDGEEHLDSQGFDMESFYQRYLNDSSFKPTTSQPSPAQFFEAIEQAFDDGASEVLILTISKKLSGTYNSASIAAQEYRELEPDAKITIYDSRATASGLSFLVDRAYDLAKQGMNAEQIIPYLDELRDRIQIFIYLSTLKYLHRGGRISHWKFFLGSMFKIKPIIELTLDGILEPSGKVKNIEQGVKALFEKATLNGKRKLVKVAIHHSSDPEGAEKLKSLLRQHYPDLPITIHLLRFVLGTHTGPGTVAIVAEVAEKPSEQN